MASAVSRCQPSATDFDASAEPLARLRPLGVEGRVLEELVGIADRLVGVQGDGRVDGVRLGPGAAVGGLDSALGHQPRPVHVVVDVARVAAVGLTTT